MKKFLGFIGWFARLVGGLCENILVVGAAIALIGWGFIEHPDFFRDLLDGNLAVFKWVCEWLLGTDHSAHIEVIGRALGAEQIVLMGEIIISLKTISFLLRSACSLAWKKILSQFRRKLSESEEDVV